MYDINLVLLEIKKKKITKTEKFEVMKEAKFEDARSLPLCSNY